MTVDSKVEDGLDKDWGDINEACLASALKYITGGSFRVDAGTALQIDPQVEAKNAKVEGPAFKGTVAALRFR